MISTPLQVRFADCDIAGHIHNAVYLHYFESGRMNFFVTELGSDWDWKKHGIILKKNTVVYHIPGRLEDQLRVEVACNQIGRSSFTLCYSIFNQENVLKAEGESVIVCFDYTINEVSSIPDFMLDVLKKHLITVKQA